MFEPVEEFLDLFAAGDVAGVGEDRVWGLDGLGDLLEGGFASAADNDAAAFKGHGAGDAGSDAATAACDEYLFVCQ